MSIAAHLCSATPEVRMPKHAGRDIGARFTGQVLTGERAVALQLQEDGVRSERAPFGSYRNIEEYDPVLRAHCRLQESLC